MKIPAAAALAVVLLLSSCSQDSDFRSLQDDLTNGNDETQYNAAIELGNRKEVRAVEAMTFIIEDDDPFVREAVAWALGEIGDPAGTEALSKAATGDEEANVRRNAIYSLGQIGDATAVMPLVGILLGEDRPNIEAFEARGEEPNEALLASFSLRRIGAPAIAPLTTAATDEDIAVQRVAVVTLGEIGLDTGDFSAVPFLTGMLSVSDTLLRETATHSLIITGDPASIGALVSALETSGTERMAGFFLNSGREELVNAATAWIAANGLDGDEVRCSVNGKAKWGDFDSDGTVSGCDS